jgi:RHS repeat-associated protein
VFIEERNNTWNTPYLFNAKELDEETGLYYYGARYYDARSSVWLSADPLQEKYPHISSYAYAFLNPIRYIDPSGMEGEPGDGDPIINPKNQDGRNPSATIDAIFAATGGQKKFEANFQKFTKGTYDASASVLGGQSHMPGYTSDSENDASTNNLWVRDKGVFKMSHVSDFNSVDLANYLLGCMINGIGPENIEYPENGVISTSMAYSGVAQEALFKFYQLNKGRTDLVPFSGEINGDVYNPISMVTKGLVHDNWIFFHPETFTGSASVTITPIGKDKFGNEALRVTIFNITSLTSGDYGKHLYGNNRVSSKIRGNDSSKNKYANISQKYSYTIQYHR